jgi:hypothetical protein
VPEHLIEGISKTTAHEILGQSVDYLQPLKLALNLFQTMNRNALLLEVSA